MGQTLPNQWPNESFKDYKKRLLKMRNSNPLVCMGFVKKRKSIKPNYASNKLHFTDYESMYKGMGKSNFGMYYSLAFAGGMILGAIISIIIVHFSL